MMRIIVFFCGLVVLLSADVAVSSAASAAATSRQLAAQSRPHITVHPRPHYLAPNAKRYCRSWLQVQHRLSGTVIVPQMVCWWG